MKPRVFLSHGAGEQDSVWRFVDEIDAALADDFQVFLDRDRIVAGQHWRPELDRELTGCHCGVLVISDRALDRPEVRREHDFLLMREGQSAEFVVVVVLVDVDIAAIKQRGAVGLDRLDVVDQPDPANAAKSVAAGLEPVCTAALDDRELAWKPRLRSMLARADPGALKAAAEALGHDIARWPWAADPRDAVAHWLLQTRDVDRLFAAASALDANDAQIDARLVFRTALPHAWIDWDAASCVRAAIEARKAVAVDSKEPDTGRMYVRRTTLEPTVETLTDVAGEDDETPLLVEAQRALERMLFGGGPVDLDELKDEVADSLPILVLPFEPPGRDAVREVLTRFPGVSLVFCAGSGPVWLEHADDVELTAPALDPARERIALRKYRSANRFRRQTGGG